MLLSALHVLHGGWQQPPLLGSPVPGLRSRAMTDITESLPWQKEGWNLLPPLDLSSAISSLVLATLATCCDLNLRPNIGEKPIPWANLESCTSSHGHCTNSRTCPLSLLKDPLTSGDGVVGHKLLAAVSGVRTDQQLSVAVGFSGGAGSAVLPTSRKGFI